MPSAIQEELERGYQPAIRHAMEAVRLRVFTDAYDQALALWEQSRYQECRERCELMLAETRPACPWALQLKTMILRAITSAKLYDLAGTSAAITDAETAYVRQRARRPQQIHDAEFADILRNIEQTRRAYEREAEAERRIQRIRDVDAEAIRQIREREENRRLNIGGIRAARVGELPANNQQQQQPQQQNENAELV